MDLNTILQQAQKLTNQTKTREELPNVERTLPQVLQATQVKNAAFYFIIFRINFNYLSRNYIIVSEKRKIFKTYKHTSSLAQKVLICQKFLKN